MTALHDIGRAKINLTLDVLGRRTDGFHELRSLVAFANFGDRLVLDAGNGLDLEVDGPFAAALGTGNLVLEAGRAARARVPNLRLGRFRLAKSLPVAAGLGGGSADAAAALRLIARANPGLIADEVLADLALELGSDVRVCLKSRPALMTGRGETIERVQGFPACGVVLANPGSALATQAVYAALDAKTAGPSPRSEAGRLDFRCDFDALLAYALPRDNDLEAPAAKLVPEISDVLAALAALEGVGLARLSGSGPTCFALLRSAADAERAAGALAAAHPAWWIASGALEA
ncbi:MAG TPA: 4-(cytidine 5'-diphospho)-2-C-methyl-D-erythritol kinase [Methyloceanibacter sp.]|nr:4-(cytidine 5'-diphospho)-2-C-methyl-D-erythritol kinase [Methyloceanibacter sp.]